MKNFRKWINIFSILQVYLSAIVIFFFFRLILFFTETGRTANVRITDILHSFFIGLRFDIVIAGYILLLPYLVLTVLFLLKKRNKFILTALFYFTLILFFLSFLVTAADIPFFNQ